MKKRMVSLLLAAAVAASTYSCGFAQGDAWKDNAGTVNLDTLEVSGEGIAVDGNTVLITQGGDFEVTGTIDDGLIKVNTEDKVKLRLSGASITNSTGPAIWFENTEKGFITITEDTENFLTDGTEYSTEDADAALFSNDDLEIKGAGALTVTGNYKHGIASDDDLSIENGAITIVSNEHGIKANNTLSVSGGTIDVHAITGKGIKAEEAIVIDNGEVNVVTDENEGIESKGTLTINGGNISIIAGEDGINTGNASTAAETADPNTATGTNEQKPQMKQEMTPPKGMEMPQNGEMPQGGRGGRGMGGGMRKGMAPQDGMQMPEGMTPPEGMQRPDGEKMPERMTPSDGGNGQRPQGGFGRVDEETAAAHAVSITGGTVYINYLNPDSDGIDANGNLSISGGTVIIEGDSNGMEGPLDSDGTTSITGGEVLILTNGGSMMLPSGDINSIRIYPDEEQAADTELVVCDSDGTELISHTAKAEYKAVIFYSEDIKEGIEYGVYADGELLGTVTAADGAAAVGEKYLDGGMRGKGGGRRDDSNKEIEVEIDGAKVDYSAAVQPVIKNDTTLVGLRAILEMLGAEVSWDEETRTVTATKDGINITLTIDSDKATVNGKEQKLLTAPQIINGSTMIPVRFISEQLGMNVDWDSSTRKVSVRSK